VRLNIASWGTTSDRDDARVAAAGMDALIRSTNSARSFTRVPVHFLGASGTLVSGLPSSLSPVTAIILAHVGVAYKILAPGVTLAPDQRHALDSVRFIPRVGPFPPVNGASAPSGPPTAVASGPSLSFTCLLPDGATVTTCRLTGRGFRPRETVRIVYGVRLGAGSRHPTSAVYRRTVTTNTRGPFARPPLQVPLNNRTLTIEVAAIGATGDHATATVTGPV